MIFCLMCESWVAFLCDLHLQWATVSFFGWNHTPGWFEEEFVVDRHYFFSWVVQPPIRKVFVIPIDIIWTHISPQLSLCGKLVINQLTTCFFRQEKGVANRTSAGDDELPFVYFWMFKGCWNGSHPVIGCNHNFLVSMICLYSSWDLFAETEQTNPLRRVFWNVTGGVDGWIDEPH